MGDHTQPDATEALISYVTHANAPLTPEGNRKLVEIAPLAVPNGEAQAGKRNRRSGVGHSFLHSAIDDRSRRVYSPATAERDHVIAVEKHAAADTRAAELLDAVAATLVPLTSSATGAPAQVEVVLDMYPRARADVVEQLRTSVQHAADAVSAELFMYNEQAPVPLAGTAPEGVATFEVVDAWRAVIIMRHLNDYSDAITAAWVTDAGGVEEALGFNPYLPFIF